MKRSVSAGLLAVAMLVSGGRASAEARVIDRVAAIVNDDMISVSEVHRRAAPELARLEEEGQASSEKRQSALKHALEELIADRLLSAEEKALSIEVTEAEIDFALEDVRRQNNLDAASFERALASQGTTLRDYREKLRKDLAAMKLIGMKVRSRIKVSDEDVKAEYARSTKMLEAEYEVHARHIVIQVPREATPEVEEAARKRAEELAKRARAGEDFTELARKHSESASKADGGDVGFFKRGEMVAAFDKVAFTLAPGGISDPVRTPFGWHVIQVVERRAGTPPPFEQVREDLRERLMREQMQRQTEQYVAELRKQAVVEIKVPELK